jgi:hypothetical protein
LINKGERSKRNKINSKITLPEELKQLEFRNFQFAGIELQFQ